MDACTARPRVAAPSLAARFPDESGWQRLLHRSFTGDNAEGGFNNSGLVWTSGGHVLTSTYSFAPGNNGAVVRMNPDGSAATPVFQLGAPGGALPFGRVVRTSNGKVFGATLTGGSMANGAVFGMNQDGSRFSVLHSFVPSVDGFNPFTGVTAINNWVYGGIVGVVGKRPVLHRLGHVGLRAGESLPRQRRTAIARTA